MFVFDNHARWFAVRLATVLLLSVVVVSRLSSRERAAIGATGPRAKTLAQQLGSKSGGTQLLMLVIGKEAYFAAQPLLMDRIREVRDSARAIAHESEMSFASSALSIDDDAERGLRWIAEVGGFDEVSAGLRWISTGALHYIWEDSAQAAVAPQILFLARAIHADAKRIQVESRSDRLSVKGARAIVEFRDPAPIRAMVYAGRARQLQQ